ncbi:hypothetical protein [Methylobacterium persicinum]|uniref:Uncharacterized protein n=1 Tax=Methylobacterium persicinum TaxID=374426 RepID=A0ABU0HL61_9HYPH|nr:hypothetical protein [Methylobacterium persicinum]MDQ0443058.1 hypothetical protein [Methylobacterium persicinum]GJE39025.1 hypothetical protein KHHGKMAE_3103 [Methylobacterium persicinum]
MAASRLCLVLVAVAALGACQSQSKVREPVVPVGGPPAPPVLPTGTGCGPEIARTRAIVASDVATENLNKSVGDRFDADLSRAASECAAGKSGEALHLLAAAKARYGYR